MAKVSVSVAIYNVAKYIEKCVRSLYEQTLDDIEILLVDDCTPDDSMEIAMRVLEEYPHRKDQVRVIHHEHNMGIALTKKDCILEAAGDYVLVIDGDDYVDVSMAEKMYNKAIATDADMVICDFYECEEDVCVRKTLVPNGLVGDGQNVRDDILNRDVSPYMWCKLVKRDIMVNNDVVWPKNGLGEDTVISVMYAYYARKLSYINEPLYYYMRNSASVTKDSEESRAWLSIESYCMNMSVYFGFLKREGETERYAKGIFKSKLRCKRLALKEGMSNNYTRLYIKMFPEINRYLLFGCKYYKASLSEWLRFILISLGCYNNIKKRVRPFLYR